MRRYRDQRHATPKNVWEENALENVWEENIGQQ